MRGFASMSPERLREVCSRGGKTAHALGVAHKWQSGEEARSAALKGAKRSVPPEWRQPMARRRSQWTAIRNPMLSIADRPKECVPGEALLHYSGLQVIESTDTLSDGRRYMHLSISHPDRYPTWEELIMTKEYFLEDEDEAVQILPRKSQYVNVHERCFHLWHCYDGDVIGQ